MAEDPFVTSPTTSQPPNIIRPIPRRNFTAYTDSSDSPTYPLAPTTPPLAYESQNRSSDFLSQLNARLLRTYNAGNANINDNSGPEGSGQLPPRNQSFLNLTKSTLFGIYDEDGGTTAERSVTETPWGTGAETPGQKSPDARKWANGLGSLDEGMAMKPRARPGTINGRGTSSPSFRPPPNPRRRGLWKYTVIAAKLAALFAFGVAYGVIVSHLHDTRELAAVRVEGMDRESWIYPVSWGLAGVALGCSLPYVELAWGGGTPEDEDAEKENEPSFGEQWNDIVRSVGAFVGIAFAIVSHTLVPCLGGGLVLIIRPAPSPLAIHPPTNPHARPRQPRAVVHPRPKQTRPLLLTHHNIRRNLFHLPLEPGRPAFTIPPRHYKRHPHTHSSAHKSR